VKTHRAPKDRLRGRGGISASGLRKIEKIINGTWPPCGRCPRSFTLHAKEGGQ
jgi:hypothetical protein